MKSMSTSKGWCDHRNPVINEKVSRVPPMYKGLIAIWELDHGSRYPHLSLPMTFPSWAQKEAEDEFPRRGKWAEG